MEAIAKSMGFRQIPRPVFEKIDLKDEIEFTKVVTRMAELGLLTADQTFATLESGLYPDPDDTEAAQQKYKADRDKGLYEPLIGGQKEDAGAEGRPAGSKAPQTTKKVKPIGSKGSEFKASQIQGVFSETTSLISTAATLLRKKYKVKTLSKEQEEFAFNIVKNVVSQNQRTQWTEALSSFIVKEVPLSDESVINEVENIAIEYELDSYGAAVMLHSKTFKK